MAGSSLSGLPNNLKRARERLGISARELDRWAGLGEGHVAMLEAGRGATLATVAKLAAVLGLSIGDLTEGDDK